MWMWPLDSAIGATAVHRASKRVADGTGTPVATCMINKWTVKINEKEIYIMENALLEWEGGKSKRRKKEEGCSSYHPWKLSMLSTKEWEEEESVLEQSPRINFYPSSIRSIIPSPYDHVRLLEFSLKPSSWAHFLYQIYCIGPVGFGLICLTVKNLPNVDLIVIILSLLILYSSLQLYFRLMNHCVF